MAAATAVEVARAKKVQALGQLNQARTTPVQVDLSKASKAQALAKIAQARAALKSAEIQLGYTRIYAPCDGQVSKKSVEVGSLVSPGYPLMALIPDQDVWIVANYKETQLSEVREGQKAEVEIDGLPGVRLMGRVDSFAAATGSTFALLPADNVTGNFTKVVQRIPVKIVLDPGQQGIERLKPGMSVLSIIEIR
jgi:membrane fusion protein (multidrug efflux system)